MTCCFNQFHTIICYSVRQNNYAVLSPLSVSHTNFSTLFNAVARLFDGAHLHIMKHCEKRANQLVKVFNKYVVKEITNDKSGKNLDLNKWCDILSTAL